MNAVFVIRLFVKLFVLFTFQIHFNLIISNEHFSPNGHLNKLRATANFPDKTIHQSVVTQ